MLRYTNCLACGAADLVRDVRVLDTGRYMVGSLHASVERNPRAILLRGAEIVELRAVVCARCGYTALFAARPGALADAQQESRAGEVWGDEDDGLLGDERA